MNESVPKQAYDLLSSHFDLLWKVSGAFLSAAVSAIVFLVLRLQAQGERTNLALNSNTEALKDLREAIRDGRKE